MTSKQPKSECCNAEITMTINPGISNIFYECKKCKKIITRDIYKKLLYPLSYICIECGQELPKPPEDQSAMIEKVNPSNSTTLKSNSSKIPNSSSEAKDKDLLEDWKEKIGYDVTLCNFIEKLLNATRWEAKREEREKCYQIIQKAFVFQKVEAIGGMYSDGPFRGPNMQTLYLVNKGDLLTNDIFIDLLDKDGELIQEGRHCIYNPSNRYPQKL